MRYISTHGQASTLDFEDVPLAGLASGSGFYVPGNLPRFTLEEIASWVGLPCHELAFQAVRPFVVSSITDAGFKKILEETYDVFAHDVVAPLRWLSGNGWVLELFRGPTLAFKDFALQPLGHLLDHTLAKRGEHVVIMGVTSDDTGSATIEGYHRYDNVDIFIMYPHNHVSEMQRWQMTTILGDSIYNIAIESNFNDCQEMVKASFADQGFLRGIHLVVVDSINWTRTMTQIVYYSYAALRLGVPHHLVVFSVPIGNFGDILADYLVHNMDLPVSQLIVAINRNDNLHRFMSGNRYDKDILHPSLSPSMDVVVSSNFERLPLDLHGCNGKVVAELLDAFRASGKLSVEDQRWIKVYRLPNSLAVSDEQTCETVIRVYCPCGKLLDPHTTVGVHAAHECWRSLSVLMVTLGTAHPVKLPEAVEKAGIGQTSTLPTHLVGLFERGERCTVLPDELARIQAFVSQHDNCGEPF